MNTIEKPHDGHHVGFHCVNHPELHWSAKIIATTPDGRYNGCRNIFYGGALRNGEWVVPEPPECPCPGSALRVDDQDRPYLDAYHGESRS